MGKYGKTGVAPLGTTQDFPLLSSIWLGSRNRVPPKHQPRGPRWRCQLLDDCPLVRHGLPQPPSAAPVGGRGAGDWPDPWHPDQDTREPFLDGSWGWGGGGVIHRQAYRPVPLLLPGSSCVRSGSDPWPGAYVPPGGWPRRNGAPIALVILHPGRLLLEDQAYLWLLVKSKVTRVSPQW